MKITKNDYKKKLVKNIKVFLKKKKRYKKILKNEKKRFIIIIINYFGKFGLFFKAM